ncbi:hypothetical protein M436DRAFT_82201 [Aureobasidium namibiae CBS 147.97]|uniref:Uncharacterized protein n=1 Tax=Aureobasidium namibiae CBS 147.97 TaxID=1043004 RepID=A0A074WMW1_9PEZI|nr:uncharacterized protein M436DRAFT_82201 [Aureobasidium namibiae CBS 147.97]KEQ72929.1 hypothetical protein M436DRAFT_82201 [Aureobasidium namibiae CBS 147.97]
MLRSIRPQPPTSSSSQTGQSNPQNDPLEVSTMANTNDAPAGHQPPHVARSAAPKTPDKLAETQKRPSDQISASPTPGAQSTPESATKKRKIDPVASGSATNAASAGNKMPVKPSSAKSTSDGEISAGGPSNPGGASDPGNAAYQATLARAKAGKKPETRSDDPKSSTGSDADEDALRAKLLEKIRVLEARIEAREAKYGGDPIEIVKRYTVNYGELVKQATAAEAFHESFVTCQHPVVQEAVYNHTVFYEMKAYNSLRGKIKISNLWLKRFYDRCVRLNEILGEAYKTMPDGDRFRDNYRAAVKAVPPRLTWDDNGRFHVSEQPVFVSQINPEEVTDLDALDDGAEDLAGQQRDLEDEVVLEEDFVNVELIDENLGNRDDAEQASNADQDEFIDLEIRDERPQGTQKKALKVTITLEY